MAFANSTAAVVNSGVMLPAVQPANVAARQRAGMVVPRSGLAYFAGGRIRALPVMHRPALKCKVNSQNVQAIVMETLPKEFGFVVLTAVASAILTQWQGIEVAKQRRKSEVPYPLVRSAFDSAYASTKCSVPSLMCLNYHYRINKPKHPTFSFLESGPLYNIPPFKGWSNSIECV